MSFLNPHVNYACLGYHAHNDNTIQLGLDTIKGIGSKTAMEIVEHGPYVSLTDMARRCNARKLSGATTGAIGITTPDELKGAMKILYESGATTALPCMSIKDVPA